MIAGALPASPVVLRPCTYDGRSAEEAQTYRAPFGRCDPAPGDRPRLLRPTIGTRALNAVRPAEVLEIIEARRDSPKTAEGVLAIIQQIFNYAIQKLLVEVNPALPLRGVIEVPPGPNWTLPNCPLAARAAGSRGPLTGCWCSSREPALPRHGTLADPGHVDGLCRRGFRTEGRHGDQIVHTRSNLTSYGVVALLPCCSMRA